MSASTVRSGWSGLVTEARSRLYPLASGEATIGEAIATLALAGGSGVDPLAWLRGRSPRREVVVRSAPLRVRVRPLPEGAPAGFDGAVGDLAARFVADRARTSRDVPATVWLDVRGVGNLPLLQPPAFESEDFEVFAATVDDSFGPPGSEGPGRRRFQWTVLPRKTGRLTIAPPEFAWFDPRSASYRRASLPELRRAVEERGRDPRSLQIVPMGVFPDDGKMAYYREVGCTEVVLRLPSAPRDRVMPVLDEYARHV